MATDTFTDAIALLKADHRKVEELFDQFEATKAATKKQQIADLEATSGVGNYGRLAERQSSCWAPTQGPVPLVQSKVQSK